MLFYLFLFKWCHYAETTFKSRANLTTKKKSREIAK